MTREEIYDIVIDSIKNTITIIDKIESNNRLVDDLYIDSLTFIEIIMEIEKTLDLTDQLDRHFDTINITVAQFCNRIYKIYITENDKFRNKEQ